ALRRGKESGAHQRAGPTLGSGAQGRPNARAQDVRWMKRHDKRQAARPVSPALLKRIDAYWRAANYLSVGQIYLYDNPLLKRRLQLRDVKPRLLGHWGTTPGLNFIYVHLNRVIEAHSLNMIFVTGPGH